MWVNANCHKRLLAQGKEEEVGWEAVATVNLRSVAESQAKRVQMGQSCTAKQWL